jgi:hypothetical protein
MRTSAFLLAAVCACAHSYHPAESKDVLERTQVAKEATVQHVLIGWSWLAPQYRSMQMTLDPRAEKRNEAQADQLATELLDRCRKGENFTSLMQQYSEDPGSSATGMVYTVDENSRFVPEFKELALKLQPGECGSVRSQFGWHVSAGRFR